MLLGYERQQRGLSQESISLKDRVGALQRGLSQESISKKDRVGASQRGLSRESMSRNIGREYHRGGCLRKV